MNVVVGGDGDEDRGVSGGALGELVFDGEGKRTGGGENIRNPRAEL